MDKLAAESAFDWLGDEGIRVIALAGICKNAGKTTLLNHFLRMTEIQRCGVFSTGIDGEETDTVFHTPKPSVRLAAGQLFCCDTTTLDSHGAAVSILEKLRAGTALRPLWLARTEVPVETSITGPSSVRAQISVLRRMQSNGAQRVFIDGSLDRKSIALSEAVDAVAVLAGASFGSVSAIRSELRRLELLNQLPRPLEIPANSAWDKFLRHSEQICARNGELWQETPLASLIGTDKELKDLLEGKPDALYIPGALTDGLLAKLRHLWLESGVQLLFRHPECLKLTLPKLEQFCSEFDPRVLVPFKIRSFALNSLALGAPETDADEWRQKLRGAFTHMALPDIRELAP